MKAGWCGVFLIPLAVSLAILYVCYPGFMSYDSIRMLEEARSHVMGGIYPAMPVYILRLFDVYGHGPTAMLLVQDFLMLASLMAILRMVGTGLIISTILLAALISMPTVIGAMLVLWKDVTLTSLMVCAIALIYWASAEGREASHLRIAKWLSIFFLIVGTLVRFNAITSTAVVLIYWVIVFYRHKSPKVEIGIFVSALVCMLLSNALINGYRFPSLQKLPRNPLVDAIMVYDLIGISRWSGVSLLPFDSVEATPSPKAPIENINRIYSPLGAVKMNENNIGLGRIVRVFPQKYTPSDIRRSWINAIAQHPLAYLSYRWDLFSEIIGATSHETFEPTHFNGIDANIFGIKYSVNPTTKLVLNYIKTASAMLIGKPWLFLLVSLAAFLCVLKRRALPRRVKSLAFFSFISGLLYIAPFFIITGTGEVRYVFPSLVLCSVPMLTLFFRAQREN